MKDIREKIELYKKERENFNLINIEKILNLDEDVLKEYIFIYDKSYTYKGLSIISASSLIESLICLIYALSIDIKLKEDLIYSFKIGLEPVIRDLKEPVYIYFFCLSIASYILNIKFMELSSQYKNAIKVLEYKEPDLKCYKYIR